MSTQGSILLEDEAATIQTGACLAAVVQGNELITFSGDLGAGKTTLCRGLIRALGHNGPVKSPTFTLVEPYQIGQMALAHFDLYRLSDSEELEFIGIRDYLDKSTLCLVEWPDKAGELLPQPDLALTLSHKNRQRVLYWASHTNAGTALANAFSSL